MKQAIEGNSIYIYIKVNIEFVYASPSVIIEVIFGGSYMD
jgi:hypothetical protein